ncbi:MAG: hypothetical protein ACPGSB_08405 [Opitutales bacterium]
MLDDRLPAPSRDDFLNYNQQPAVEGAPLVAGVRPQTYWEMKIGKIRLTLLAVILTSFGFLVRGYTHLWDISDWPTTKGNITDYDSGTRSSPSYSKYRMQDVVSEEWNWIEYEYSLEGVGYTSTRVSPNMKATFPYKRKEERISVFYNPENHSESYLRSDRYHNPLLLGIFVASVIGLCIDLFYYKRKMAVPGGAINSEAAASPR